MKRFNVTLSWVFIFLAFAANLSAQNVGVGTPDPVHPFQVNVDSIHFAIQADQSVGGQNGFLPIVSGLGAGQRLVCNLTGGLAKVDLRLNYTGMSTGTVRLKVRQGSTPSGTVLSQNDVNVTSATSTLYQVILGQPYPEVETGDSLFLEVTYLSGGNMAWSKNSANPYAPGIAYIYTGTWSTLSGDDMIFGTHVNLVDTASIPVLQVTNAGRVALKNYTLPEVDGEEGDVMVTDGNGDVSWIHTDTLLTGFWRIGGNSGTNAANNFIGTTDNQPLKFRIRNKNAGLIDSTRRNTAIGFLSIDSLTTGTDNSALGYQALRRAKTAIGNTAIGAGVMAGNFTGAGSVGNYNTAIGGYALSFNSNTGSYNTASGYIAMLNHNTGSYNSAFGYRALDGGGGSNNAAIGATAAALCIGSNNVAIGSSALSSNTGNANVAIGVSALANNFSTSFNKSYLVAVGDSALFNNGIGSSDFFQSIENTAIGSKALFSNTTGYTNTAVGFKSMRANTVGVENTAMGSYSMQANLTGTRNAAVGTSTLFYNTSGSFNAVLGYFAMHQNISGVDNTAMGSYAMYNNNTGRNNVAAGRSALYSNSSGKDNVALGLRALFSNSTRSNLVAIGDSALYNNGLDVTEIFHATRNTAIGSKALYANSSGRDNTAVGNGALKNNTKGNSNTGMGTSALLNNGIGANELVDQGCRNTAFGDHAMYSNNLGGYNTAIGFSAMYLNTSGYFNSAFGHSALINTTTGHDNTAVGLDALSGNTSGNYNTALGSGSMSVGNYDNSTGVGYDADPTASNRIHVGNSQVSWIGGQVGWSTYSDGRFKSNVQENVHGLDFISRLRPVTYTYDLDAMQDWKDMNYGERDSLAYPEKYEIESYSFSGFIAQEVQSAANASGYVFSGLCPPKHDKDFYSLRYAEFVVPLVKAVQEQQTTIADQQSMISDLLTRIEALERRE